MKINVSPKGRSIGYAGKPKKRFVPEEDPLTNATLQYLKTASKMEDETELAISKIEALRKDTLRKAQV
mgnify:FL=1|tara:strand:- start:276 stop:479 length:204 start_codon:yes stop_codon:yes gene_type:complete